MHRDLESLLQSPQALKSWVGTWRQVLGATMVGPSQRSLGFPFGVCSQSHDIIYLLIPGPFLQGVVLLIDPSADLRSLLLIIINCLWEAFPGNHTTGLALRQRRWQSTSWGPCDVLDRAACAGSLLMCHLHLHLSPPGGGMFLSMNQQTSLWRGRILWQHTQALLISEQGHVAGPKPDRDPVPTMCQPDHQFVF